VTVARTETIKVAGQTVGTRAIQTVYDVLGLVTSLRTPRFGDGGDDGLRYDTSGNLTRVTVGGVSVATLEYDLAGNRTKMTDASSGTTEFGFNALGELTRTTDAKGQATVYEHDPLGRLVRRTDAGGIAHTWAWDPSNGRGSSVRVPAGLRGVLCLRRGTRPPDARGFAGQRARRVGRIAIAAARV